MTHRDPCVCLAGVSAACRAAPLSHPRHSAVSVLAAPGNRQELKELLMAGPTLGSDLNGLDGGLVMEILKTSPVLFIYNHEENHCSM